MDNLVGWVMVAIDLIPWSDRVKSIEKDRKYIYRIFKSDIFREILFILLSTANNALRQ